MKVFNVYLNHRLIDTLFYGVDNVDRDEVKRSLVNHDGYDSRIVVTNKRLVYRTVNFNRTRIG